MKNILLPVAAVLCSVHFTFAEDEVAALPEMLVTPTGTEKIAFETSLPVNLVEAEELEEKITSSIGTIFETEPGVDVVSAGNGSVHPMIRGLHGERVLVLVDGIRLSEQRPGGNHVFSLDPAQIEKVEVVRGPASVLYGSDAIGGVVNFITKGAEERTESEARVGGEASVQYDSATDGLKESAHLKFGKGHFNGYLGGTYTDAENIETPEGELNNSFYDGYTLWTGGNYIGDGWKFEADYSFMKADVGIPSAAAFAEDYFKDEKHHRLSMGLEMDDFGSNVLDRMRLDFGWQRHNRHRYRRKTAATPPPVIGDLEVDIQLDIDTYTLKPQIFLTPNDSHYVTMGFDFFYEDAASGRTIGDTGSNWVHPVYNNIPVIPDSDRLGIGAFIQDEILVGDNWVMTPGLRVDWIEAQTDGHPGHAISDEDSSENYAFSGNLGLLYRLTDEVNIYSNVGRAFRAPTLLELYFYGPHDVANDIGNPDLDSETSWNFDLGVKVKTEKLQAMTGVFYNIVDDYIAKERRTDGNYYYTNYDSVTLYGAEAGLDYEIGSGFSTFASASYVFAEDDGTGDYLPEIPPFKCNYGIRYENDFAKEQKFWIEFSGLTASDQNKIHANEKKTSGYTRLDLHAGVDLGKNWSLIVGVENLTDELYYDHLSYTWQGLGVSDNPGRNVQVMLKGTF